MRNWRYACFAIILLGGVAQLGAEEFVHHSDVVRKVNKVFSGLQTYSANFQIKVKDEKTSRTVSGKAYYKTGGRINFTFHSPAGDKIISDGKTLWVYVAKLRAAGRQPYSSDSMMAKASMKGILNLFKLYHYKFDKPEQPRKTDSGECYVLSLKEKTASGGFDSIKVYVDSKKYLIRRMVGYSPGGRVVDLRFKNIRLNPEIAPEKFEYKPSGNIKIIDNPLTTD